MQAAQSQGAFCLVHCCTQIFSKERAFHVNTGTWKCLGWEEKVNNLCPIPTSSKSKTFPSNTCVFNYKEIQALLLSTRLPSPITVLGFATMLTNDTNFDTQRFVKHPILSICIGLPHSSDHRGQDTVTIEALFAIPPQPPLKE